MTTTSALTLFQNIKEGMETGRIVNLNAARTEVEAAIAELGRGQETTHMNDLVGKLLLEVASLHQKVAKCESQLAELQCHTTAFKKDTTPAEASDLPVEQQQKLGDTKVPAATEEAETTVSTASPPRVDPAPSPIDSNLRPAPSRTAVVSFPGGSRTITIHPPDSPSYQPVIRDEQGDVILNFRRTKPLRREGAFRGPIEDIDWLEITRVYGRGPDPQGTRVVPPVPRWPDWSQPSSCPTPSRRSGDLITRQRQLSTSMHTDQFGRVLPPEHPNNATSLLLPTGVSSSSSSQHSQSSSDAKPEIVSTPSSTPPSPSLGRDKKRARGGEDDGDAPLTFEKCEEAALSAHLRSTKEPASPMPIKLGEPHTLESPAKRKKLRSSVSLEAKSAGPLSRTHTLLDLTRAA